MLTKKSLLISSAALLLLSSTALLQSPPVQASQNTPVATLAQEDTYRAIPVSNAWDYSVWSNHRNGQRIGSLNDVPKNTVLHIGHEATVDGIKMVHFESEHLSGWVAKDAIIAGVYDSEAEATPGKNAQDFGVWTHFRGGRHITNLTTYAGEDLMIRLVVGDWALINDWENDLGWVNLKGLNQYEPIGVSYDAVPVNNAWDYSVWSHYENGTRLGSLNNARNQSLWVTQEMVVDGVTMVYFESYPISGWVAKDALIMDGTEIWEEGLPVHNAWDFGLWSHFSNGTRLDSLNSYRGHTLTAVLRASNGFVLVKDGNTTIGWVHESGIRFGAEAFKPYTGIPVRNAWDYSVWSNHTNGKRLGSMNDYANKLVRVEAESPDGTMVQFKIDGKVIGWVSPNALLEGEEPVDSEIIQDWYTQEIEFEKEVVEDDTLLKGEEYIKQEGQNGEKKITEQITYINGEEVGRKVISETVIKEAVKEIKVVGTREAEAPYVDWMEIDEDEVYPGEEVTVRVQLHDADGEAERVNLEYYQEDDTYMGTYEMTAYKNDYYEVTFTVPEDAEEDKYIVFALEVFNKDGKYYELTFEKGDERIDNTFYVKARPAVEEEPKAEEPAESVETPASEEEPAADETAASEDQEAPVNAEEPAAPAEGSAE